MGPELQNLPLGSCALKLGTGDGEGIPHHKLLVFEE